MVEIILKRKKGEIVIRIIRVYVFFLVGSNETRTGIVKESRNISLIEKEWLI